MSADNQIPLSATEQDVEDAVSHEFSEKDNLLNKVIRTLTFDLLPFSFLKKANRVLTDDIMPVLLWNIPLAIFLFGYMLAYSKLSFLAMSGFKIMLWNDKTETAISFTIWLYNNAWIFIVFAILLNAVYLFVPRKKPVGYLRWIFFVSACGLALWYANLGFYLFGKVITL